MSCAARARRLDEAAEIIVLERGPHVSFANCSLPYYIGGEITDPAKLLVQTASLRAALNLDVRPRRGHRRGFQPPRGFRREPVRAARAEL